MASFTSTVSDWSVCVVLFSISMQKYDSTFLHNVSIDTVSCVGPTSLDTISTTPALDGYVLTTASEQSAATHMSRSFPASLWCFRTTHRNDWKVNVFFVQMKEEVKWPDGRNKLGAKDKWINAGYVSVSSIFVSNMHKIFCNVLMAANSHQFFAPWSCLPLEGKTARTVSLSHCQTVTVMNQTVWFLSLFVHHCKTGTVDDELLF